MKMRTRVIAPSRFLGYNESISKLSLMNCGSFTENAPRLDILVIILHYGSRLPRPEPVHNSVSVFKRRIVSRTL